MQGRAILVLTGFRYFERFQESSIASLLAGVISSKERQKGNCRLMACLPPSSRVPSLVESSHRILHRSANSSPKIAELRKKLPHRMLHHGQWPSDSYRVTALHFSAGRWRFESWIASVAMASSWPSGPGNSNKSAKPCTIQTCHMGTSASQGTEFSLIAPCEAEALTGFPCSLL